MRRFLAIAIIAGLPSLPPQHVLAQSAAAKPKAAVSQPITSQQPDPVLAQKPPMPDVTKMTLLVQTHMAALSHALVTGNFTVLHGLGAPGFQKLNPPDQLATKFAQFRSKGIDLLPVVLFQPVLVSQPQLDEQGLLRLTGYYNTEPQQVHFDLLFQPVVGSWRMLGISASTAFPKAASAAEQPTATQQAAAAAAGKGKMQKAAATTAQPK